MLLYAIMDSSAMPALSVYCSPEGSVPYTMWEIAYRIGT